MRDNAPLEKMPRQKSQDKNQRFRELDTDYQPVNWKRLFLAPKYLACWIITIIAIVLTILLTVYHDQVVEHLRPWSEKVRDLPAGWLIPIAILIVLSFPPLFGHEIIALLCGVVYGLWIGFGVVAAGTFFGELGTWFAFTYLFRRKAEKLERTNLSYGALARLTRDGGFWIVLLIRFSAIPSHFSTAVFSTCGVNFWFFAIATLVTLPKQIFLVYLGVLLVEEQSDNLAKNIVFAVAFVATIAMAVYIWWKMRKIKRVLLEEQAARRKAKVTGEEGVDGGEEGRQWLMEAPASPPGPFGGREYEVVGQEEADIGVVAPGRVVAAGEPYGPHYRSDFGYHGAAGGRDMGKEPVREQAWV
ncbi:snare associated Golgi protein-domain-containing protein [Chaetomium fimeti]|uniref:Golgi apparatus membrane protein TVP38 n=1 Tax=Chaetomium fimeti TaxID=1854472 RepID=A0AAE0H6U9_9PEZI|nr:snare associated Golgi protein-domain-containing protein [Chaetomium fimeti]